MFGLLINLGVFWFKHGFSFFFLKYDLALFSFCFGWKFYLISDFYINWFIWFGYDLGQRFLIFFGSNSVLLRLV